MHEPLAFTEEHVCRVTGLSPRQVRYWDRTGVLSPRYGDPDRRRPYSGIYSFRDVVSLRTLAQLRKCGVPLQELRRVGKWLADRYDCPWANLRFYLAGRRVYFDDPDTDARVAGQPSGQTVFLINLEAVANETRAAAECLLRRGADQVGRVSRHRYVMHNAPVLAGTRIPTAAIWDFHREGYDVGAILREYPRLQVQDVHAAIAFETERRQERAG
jgi:uncharacterized protein (DUF433 family)/DNA-binding transcriptional MerR regulator